ncbi:MAG: IS110 family transposase [Methanocorpusculum sp.]|nr:IS110 family transposase [Methanocorpusculum sp.]
MTEKRRKACGIDVHKVLLVATIQDTTGMSVTRQYWNTLESIASLRSWIVQERCDVVAFESTGSYWFTLYECLYSAVTVEVANAYYIKHVPGKKTDTLDSQWIAQLALNNQITPSRIFTGDLRNFRSLTRYRSKLVEDRTFYKNIVHNLLDASDIHLSTVTTDIFGKSGMLILKALSEGKNIETIFSQLSPGIFAKKDLLVKAVSASLNQSELIQLRSCLNLLDTINRELKDVEERISWYVQANQMSEVGILCSIPGMGITSASVILSEIGDIRDFMKPGNLASWAGIVPSIYQSAGTIRSGAITKKGNEHLRWIIVECAHGCARKKGTKLAAFFERIKKRAGYKKAIVALGRKLLTLIWHLLMNHEKYEDEG